jgi:hypothetical protein
LKKITFLFYPVDDVANMEFRLNTAATGTLLFTATAKVPSLLRNLIRSFIALMTRASKMKRSTMAPLAR